MAKIKIRKKTKVIPHKKSTKVDWQKAGERELPSYNPDVAPRTSPDDVYYRTLLLKNRPRKFNPAESQVKKYKIVNGKKVYKYKKVKSRTKGGGTDVYYERNPKYFKIK